MPFFTMSYRTIGVSQRVITQPNTPLTIATTLLKLSTCATPTKLARMAAATDIWKRFIATFAVDY
jgi:hypothetical protein